MVVFKELSDGELDAIFRALSHATRRDIVARVLGGEPASVSDLASRYDMSFAAVQKHVAVLEEAGLVSKEVRGRERLVRGNPERIARARGLLAQLEQLWRARFGQLDEVLSDPTVPDVSTSVESTSTERTSEANPIDTGPPDANAADPSPSDPHAKE